MGDRAISELTPAENVGPYDLFVLEQDKSAKKLTGQVLEKWLTSFADGHGGIQSWEKVSTKGLVDTYRFTMADGEHMDISVTNGRSVTSFVKEKSARLVDTWRMFFNDNTHVDIPVTNGRGIVKIEDTGTTGTVVSGITHKYKVTYNDGTTENYSIKDGIKGDKGDNSYTWIKFASADPAKDPSSFGDDPNDWIGFATGNKETAPTKVGDYKWYKIKGDKGDKGDPSLLTNSSVTYQVSDSGAVRPSSWVNYIPTVLPGKYLWTRIEHKFNSGSPVIAYSVSRFGIDGTGAVSAVNTVPPDSDGNVTLTSESIKRTGNNQGQTVEEALNQKQDSIKATGMLKGNGNGDVGMAEAGIDYQEPLVAGTDYQTPSKSLLVTLPASSWDSSTQKITVQASGVTTSNNVFVSPAEESYTGYTEAQVRCCKQESGKLQFACASIPESNLSVNVFII